MRLLCSLKRTNPGWLPPGRGRPPAPRDNADRNITEPLIFCFFFSRVPSSSSVWEACVGAPHASTHLLTTPEFTASHTLKTVAAGLANNLKSLHAAPLCCLQNCVPGRAAARNTGFVTRDTDDPTPQCSNFQLFVAAPFDKNTGAPSHRAARPTRSASKLIAHRRFLSFLFWRENPTTLSWQCLASRTTTPLAVWLRGAKSTCWLGFYPACWRRLGCPWAGWQPTAS